MSRVGSITIVLPMDAKERLDRLEQVTNEEKAAIVKEALRRYNAATWNASEDVVAEEMDTNGRGFSIELRTTEENFQELENLKRRVGVTSYAAVVHKALIWYEDVLRTS